MLDMSKITAALVAQLEEDAELMQLKAIVSRNRYLNMDPGNTPWIGVYKNSVPYEPRSLGRHSTSWKASPDLRVVVQMGGFDEVKVENRLEDLIKRVLDAIWAAPTIDSQVDMVTGLHVDYSFQETESEDEYFQWAIISVKLEASTG